MSDLIGHVNILIYPSAAAITDPAPLRPCFIERQKKRGIWVLTLDYAVVTQQFGAISSRGGRGTIGGRGRVSLKDTGDG